MTSDLDIRPPSSPNLTLAFDAAVKRAFRGYSVEMSTPAPSAGSGVQTLRHIRLVPINCMPLLIGWANPAEGQAELRTLGYTLALSKSRLGRELAIPPVEYLRFLGLARTCLQERGLTVNVVAYSKSVAALDAHPTPRPRRATIPHFGFVAAASLSALASVAGEMLI